MRFSSVLLVLALLGCAPNYYKTYKEKEPHWYGGGPRVGVSLHETLAGLYEPRVADYSLIVAKLDVLRLEGDTVVVLNEEEIDAVLARDASGDYGVVATLSCQSEYAMERFHGEKVAWYLLPDGDLAAWDHFDFVDRCTVSNQFRPARRDDIAKEALVLAHRDEAFPQSMRHVGQLYRRGIAYVGAGRLDDARRMLREGDAALDVGSRGERHVDMEASTRVRAAKASDVERARAFLVEKLAEAEAEGAAGPGS